jgi:hypothetical protein
MVFTTAGVFLEADIDRGVTEYLEQALREKLSKDKSPWK